MRFTVGRKLILAFLAIVLLTLGGGVFSIMQIQKINAATHALADLWLPASVQVGSLSAAAAELESQLQRSVVTRDRRELPAEELALQADQSSFAQQLTAYRKLTAGQETAALDTLSARWADYAASVARAGQLLHAGRVYQAAAIAKGETSGRYDALRGALEQLLRADLGNGHIAAQQADDVFWNAFRITVAAVIMVMMVAMGLGLWLAQHFTRSLTAVVGAAEGIAGGDLEQDVPVTSHDEFGDLARAFKDMVLYLKAMAAVSDGLSHGDLAQVVTPKGERDVLGHAFARMVASLRAMVGEVRQAAHAVAEAADTAGSAVNQTSSSMEEMAASIQQVAGSTETLAGNVEETSSSIEQMAASIQQVAGNADALSSAVGQTSSSIAQMSATIEQVAGNVLQANQVALRAAEAARGGSEAVEQTIAGMGRINAMMGEVVAVIQELGKSSAEIGAIVELIDDIAEQTNLLALNAAIEAARAGEHGHGFAVVADEVRKLAERSAKATKEIAQLIKGIRRETELAISSTQQGNSAIQEGTQLAHQAGRALGAIVESVGHVTTLMGQITEATQEQASASAQISDASSHMNQLTQKVSLATGEQARSSEQIIKAVDMMNRLTRKVSSATAEQKNSGDQAVEALENINLMALDLQRQAQSLLAAIAFFKDGAPPARALQLTVEEARALSGASAERRA